MSCRRDTQPSRVVVCDVPRANFELLLGATLLVVVACSAPWLVVASGVWTWHSQRRAREKVSLLAVHKAVLQGGLYGGLLSHGSMLGSALWSAARLGGNTGTPVSEQLSVVAAPIAAGLLGVVVEAWLLGLAVRLVWPWVAKLRAE